MNQANYRDIPYLLVFSMEGSGIQQITPNPTLSAQSPRWTTTLREEPLALGHQDCGSGHQDCGSGRQDCTLNAEAHPPTPWTTPLQEVFLPLTTKTAGLWRQMDALGSPLNCSPSHIYTNSLRQSSFFRINFPLHDLNPYLWYCLLWRWKVLCLKNPQNTCKCMPPLPLEHCTHCLWF